MCKVELAKVIYTKKLPSFMLFELPNFSDKYICQSDIINTVCFSRSLTVMLQLFVVGLNRQKCA